MDWSHVNWLWIFVIFLSAVSTLILTAPIHCRGSTGEQVIFQVNCFKSFSMKKQTHPHLGWPEGEYIFSKCWFLGELFLHVLFFFLVEFCYFLFFLINIIIIYFYGHLIFIATCISPFPFFKGAVCRILTLLKHKNTIICLQTFRKHVKLTYLFIWKTMLQSVILLWKCASGPECLCLLWFVKPAHCQFTQLYFGTPCCQLVENTTYFISFIIMCARSCWCR